MKVSRSASWEEGYDLLSGNAGASLISPPPTKAELAALRKELREKDAKRKPVGFGAWPKDVEVPLGSHRKPPKATGGSRKGKTPPGSRKR